MIIPRVMKISFAFILLLAVLFAVLALPWEISSAQSNGAQNLQPDLIGVVKSVSGSKITIYIAKLSAQGNNMGFGRGRVELTNKTQTITVSSKI